MKLFISNFKISDKKTCIVKSIGITFILFISFSAISQTITPTNPISIPEYDSVEAVVMYWNPSDSNYQGSEGYSAIASAIINAIQAEAWVYLQTNSLYHKNIMINRLTEDEVPLDNIVFLENVEGERIWIRDHGPFSIYDNDTLAIVGFNDLANSGADEDMPKRLAEELGLDFYDLQHIIYDGGNYLVDSHNRLFTTERLYSNNPNISASDIDEALERYMGIKEIITFRPMHNDYWGHIDMQIKLLNDTTFIISTVDENDPQYENLEYNYQKLLSIEHPEGKEYTIRKIPKSENWKTYTNSLIVNNRVLITSYNDPEKDAFALGTYQSLLPEKEIVGIDSNHMIVWHGAIHCVTNQLPPLYRDTEGADDDENPTHLEYDQIPSETHLTTRIYPNPANKYLDLVIKPTIRDNYQIDIVNIKGEFVYSNTLPIYSIAQHSIRINIDSIEKGLYFITVMNTEEKTRQRFIKQ